MKLFKFVSNIEISFMLGKLILEVYRRAEGVRFEAARAQGG